MQTQDRVIEILDIVQRVAALGNYDSNTIGMAAEIIAEDVFGMQKVMRGTRDIDGFWMVDDLRKTVQVKAWSEARVKRYKSSTFLRLKVGSEPDKLLVLLVRNSRAGYDVLYDGSPLDVGYVEKSGLTRAIPFRAMKSIAEIKQILDDL
jgi:hypothetical protein